jgi:membrane-associated phospholipid phosphatase
MPFRAFPGAPQTQNSQAASRFNAFFIKKFGQDFKDVVISPAQWRARDVFIFSALAGTCALIYGVDRDIYDWFQENRSSSTEDASPYISKFGNGAYLAAFLAALYGSGEAFDSPGLRKTALLGLESFLTTTAFVLTLKVVSGRARPNTGESPFSFHPLSFKTGHTSFPSGDAAGAFSVATIIAERSPQVCVDALAYGIAGLVALYRVHDRKHWPTDVFAGSAIGFFVGKKIARLNRHTSSEGFHISFQWTRGRQAVSFALEF